MNSTKLFLDETYELDGVILTGADIKEALIDNIIMKQHLTKEGDSE